MDPARLLPIQFALSLTGYAIVYLTLLRPWLDRQDAHRAVMILGAPQLFRHLGANLLVAGLVSPAMPESFAWKTAVGDTLTVVLATIGIVALHRRWAFAVWTAWLFNIVGCADLLINVTRAARTGIAAELHAAWYVPAFIVPGMLAAHVASFSVLWRRRGELNGSGS